LKYVGSQRLIEGVQHKLMLKLLEFDYQIEYKKGVENTAADALSRQFQQNEDDSCSLISQAIPAWIEDISLSYEKDEACTKLLQELAINKDSNPKFSLHNGILRYKGKLYIGQSTDLRTRLFHAFHSSSLGGHSGNRVTLHKLKNLFYWPHLKQFVLQQVAECLTCQI
jgi:hypothetical protein